MGPEGIDSIRPTAPRAVISSPAASSSAISGQSKPEVAPLAEPEEEQAQKIIAAKSAKMKKSRVFINAIIFRNPVFFNEPAHGMRQGNTLVKPVTNVT
jgi:hypothetical protein